MTGAEHGREGDRHTVSDERGPHFPPSSNPWDDTPAGDATGNSGADASAAASGQPYDDRDPFRPPAPPPTAGAGHGGHDGAGDPQSTGSAGTAHGNTGYGSTGYGSTGYENTSYGSTGYDNTGYGYAGYGSTDPAGTPYGGPAAGGTAGFADTRPYGDATADANVWATPANVGWPHQPSPAAPPTQRRYGALVALTLVAALIGGAVGGTIAYNAADDETSVSVSALGAPASADNAGNDQALGAIEKVAATVIPSVVSIDVGGLGQGGLGSGSGVVISSDGLILTNNHVAGQGDLAVTFSNGETVRARLIKADPSTDLAVIKAIGVTDAQPVTFGSSANLRVGQDVIAIGAPLGLAGTVTRGIVSALQRPVIPQQATGGAGSVIDGIQTDAPINPGNSGGALVDLNGNLIGITSAIASLGSAFGGQSGSIGLGFAIPIDQARVIAEQLARGETVAHALLGVQVTNSRDATQRGALIREVTSGGAADAAGLRSGDVVIRLDDRVIDTSDALVAGVRSMPPGETVRLTYLRDGEQRSTEATLGSDLDR